ncbi:hypothetical protein SUGI_0991830 [Cryptomeria japonica]|nr:hypothetical protein SUGI_0991830 [Cryptomeria japonica]
MEGEFICGVEEEGEQVGLSKLPRHIKKSIFEKLPLQSISRSRLVCKEWNSILLSHSFISSLPKSNPWLLLYAEKYCMAYCFTTHKWMKISLSSLPTPKDFRDYTLSSAHLGLLAFLLETPDLYICNSLARDYGVAKLGLFSDWGNYARIESDVIGTVIGIVQGDQSSDEPYLIAKMGPISNVRPLCIRVYHYFQDSWSNKLEFIEEREFSIRPFTMVACNGVLFFEAYRPTGYVGYNIRGAFIKPVRIDELPCHILQYDKVHKLFMGEYGLSLLLVVMKEGSLNDMIIFEFFEDDKDELVWHWREFATVPPTSLPRCFHRGYEKCVVVGDYLCFIKE